MDREINEQFDNLESTNDILRMNALKQVMLLTDNKVNWVYEVWDLLINKLNNENSFQRSIAIFVLCNLAKSDKENRMAKLLPKILAHTKDDKFITSRQCILNVWKIAATSKQMQEKVVKYLESRYKECLTEKHYNLLRQDIIQTIRFLYNSNNDKTLLTLCKKLIAQEIEDKYRKKYLAILQ
jgi:hypothetical protein